MDGWACQPNINVVPEHRLSALRKLSLIRHLIGEIPNRG